MTTYVNTIDWQETGYLADVRGFKNNNLHVSYPWAGDVEVYVRSFDESDFVGALPCEKLPVAWVAQLVVGANRRGFPT